MTAQEILLTSSSLPQGATADEHLISAVEVKQEVLIPMTVMGANINDNTLSANLQYNTLSANLDILTTNSNLLVDNFGVNLIDNTLRGNL